MIHSCATNYLQRYIVTFKVSLAWYRYRLCFHPFVIFYKSSTPSSLPSSPPHRSTQKTTITLLNTSPQTQAQAYPGKPPGQRNAITKRKQSEWSPSLHEELTADWSWGLESQLYLLWKLHCAECTTGDSNPILYWLNLLWLCVQTVLIEWADFAGNYLSFGSSMAVWRGRILKSDIVYFED